MKILTAALIGGTMLASPATFAADIYGGSTKDGPAGGGGGGSRMSWGGLYFGGSVGVGVGDTENDVTLYETAKPANALPFLPSIDELTGAVYGVHGGFNFHRDRWVVGLEATFDGTSIEGTSTAPGLLGSLIQTNTEIDWYSTLVARVGIASGDTMLYGFGGLALAEVTNSSAISLGLALPGGSARLNDESETQWGWTAGVGIEHAIDNHWIARVQYGYVDLDGNNSSVGLTDARGRQLGITSSQDSDTSFHTIKIGGSYKF